jgi:hypothetical protein
VKHTRRAFLQASAAGGIGALLFTVAGCESKMTPAQARAAGADFHTLKPEEVATLDALGEILLPGSAALGLSHFIDHQLSGDPAQSMLMIKYLRVPAPFVDFYRAGLAATEAAARSESGGKGLAQLSAEEGTTFVGKMAAGGLAKWDGPPAPFFFFVLRNDAVDVTYGTPAGFDKLGVPYMPHIAPPTPWGA